jgi:HEAT repeat protein
MKLDFQKTPLIAGTIALVLVSLTPDARSQGTGSLDADAVVLQLRDLPAELYIGPTSHLCNPAPAPCSPPRLPSAEIKRQRIYSQLSALGSASVAALARGLQNDDASVRSNAALALYVLSDESLSSDRVTPRVDIRAALPALIVALDYSAMRLDSRTGALAAQAIGNIGARGVDAVPSLVKLLSSEDEGLRNGACIGLGGIGPSARSALPELKRALADPSNNVREFARLAIAKISGSVPP